MDLKSFYEAIQPQEGRRVLFNTRTKQHIFCDTVDELVALTEARIEQQDWYYAMSTFAADRRKQEVVVGIKSFWLDLDAGEEKLKKHGPEKVYATQKEAIASVVAAIKAGLPLPTLLVSSGEGLHVYWCLDDEMGAAEWKAVALQLNAASEAVGLKVDAGCTADSARVLRPVGTLHKNGSRVTVLKNWDKRYEPGAFQALLKPLAPVMEMPSAKPRVASINDDVLAAVEGPPASLARVAEHCSAVALMRDSGGNIPEPHWRAVMGVAKHCEDGEELIHEWSSGHPDYNARETQEKLDRWETPPSTCQHFSLMHSGCNTCPYKGKITTPKQVGYIAIVPAEPAPPPLVETTMAMDDDTEAPSDSPVPERPDLFDPTAEFYWKVDGGRWTLYHRYKDKSTDATGQSVWIDVIKPVAYKLFWVGSSSEAGASDANGVVVEFGKIERTGTKNKTTFTMPSGTVADIKGVCKHMADNGIYVVADARNKKSALHLQEYVRREMILWSEQMRFVIKDRFGYHFHEGQFVCAMGRYTVYPNAEIINTMAHSKLNALHKNIAVACLDPKQSRAGVWGAGAWKQIGADAQTYVSFLRKHYGHAGYENARLAIAINLASPFLVFCADSAYTEGSEALPATGFALSMYSEKSGIGKTSIMSAIAAAYGREGFIQKGGSSITDIATLALAVGAGVYPFLMDEVSQNDAKRTAGLISAFADGKGRTRSRNTGVVGNSSDNFCLVYTVATNIPQRELLSQAKKQEVALQARLLELGFDSQPPAADMAAFRADLKLVQEKCGAYGMLQSLQAVRVGVKKLTDVGAANVNKAFELLDVPQSYRFYARMLGAMLTCQQSMGKFFPFDMDELISTFKAGLRHAVTYTDENFNTPEAELGALVSYFSPQIVVTKGWTKRTGRSEGADIVLNHTVHTPLVGREVQDWGCVLIEVGAVRTWCTEQQVSYSAFIKRMADTGLLVVEEGKMRRKYRLTTGISNMVAPAAQDFHKFRLRAVDAASDGGNVVELRKPDAPQPTQAEEQAA